MPTAPGNDPDSDWRVPEERRRRIAELLRAHGSVTIGMLEEEFAISPMTARRDLAELERQGRARRRVGKRPHFALRTFCAVRTSGWSLAPSSQCSPTFFNPRPDSAAEHLPTAS